MINVKRTKKERNFFIRLRILCEEMVKSSCWKASAEGEEGEGSGRVDGLLWYKDLGNHVYGEFSMAVVQANESIEDRSQLESGPFTSNQATFIGVYDGHGGSEASQFVTDNLFSNLKSMYALSNFKTRVFSFLAITSYCVVCV